MHARRIVGRENLGNWIFLQAIVKNIVVKDIRLAFSRSEAAALMIESGATCACSLMRPERFDNEGGILGNICQRMRVWLLGDDSVPLTLSLASQPPRPQPPAGTLLSMLHSSAAGAPMIPSRWIHKSSRPGHESFATRNRILVATVRGARLDAACLE